MNQDALKQVPTAVNSICLNQKRSSALQSLLEHLRITYYKRILYIYGFTPKFRAFVESGVRYRSSKVLNSFQIHLSWDHEHLKPFWWAVARRTHQQISLYLIQQRVSLSEGLRMNSLLFSLLLLANVSPLNAFSPSLIGSSSSTFQRLSPLQSTKQQKDFVLTSDKGVVKEVLVSGKGRRIEAGDILAVEYSAFIQGQKVPFAKGNKEQFIVKDGSLIKGWDIAIESMRIGEVSKISIANSYAYGAKGVSPIIPPGESTSTTNTYSIYWQRCKIRI